MNKPIEAEILVVEGWINYRYFDLIVEEFKKGDYQQIITTGGYYSDTESDTSWLSFPQRAAEILIEHGINEKNIVQLPWKEFHSTKTYSSFLPLKNWLLIQEPQIKALNLYTASVHARKSYLLCQKALGKNYKLGIIAGKPIHYNPKFWMFSKRSIWLAFKNTGSLIVNAFQQ